MSNYNFERVRKKLSHQGEPKEIFRIKNVHTKLDTITKHFIGDLVFTNTAICFILYAEYKNLKEMLRENLFMGIFLLYGPGAFIFSLIGGTIGMYMGGGKIGGGKEGLWSSGAFVGVIISIFLSTYIISKINENSKKKALEKLNKTRNLESEKSFDNILTFYWRDKIDKITHDRTENILKISGQYIEILVDVPYEEWNKNSIQISNYLAKKQ